MIRNLGRKSYDELAHFFLTASIPRAVVYQLLFKINCTYKFIIIGVFRIFTDSLQLGRPFIGRFVITILTGFRTRTRLVCSSRCSNSIRTLIIKHRTITWSTGWSGTTCRPTSIATPTLPQTLSTMSSTQQVFLIT